MFLQAVAMNKSKRNVRSANLSVPVGHQGDRHDVLHHGPGREELLSDENSAGRTQTLIVQSDRDRRNRLDWPGGIQLHTLLLDLHRTDTRSHTFVFESNMSKRTEGKMSSERLELIQCVRFPAKSHLPVT